MTSAFSHTEEVSAVWWCLIPPGLNGEVGGAFCVRSLCVSVCMSVCRHEISCNFWTVQDAVVRFRMHLTGVIEYKC